jgi:hypothetical protein
MHKHGSETATGVPQHNILALFERILWSKPLANSRQPAVPFTAMRPITGRHCRCLALKRQIAFIFLVGSIAGICRAQTLAAHPILFIHGICDTADSWKLVYQQIRSYAVNDPYVGNQYAADPNSVTPQELYYDGTTVRTWPDGNDMLTSPAQFASTRFFCSQSFRRALHGAAAFYNPNVTEVAEVSVPNKGDEVAQAEHVSP